MMRQFYLTAAAAIVVTTSLASNLLWVTAFGPRTAGVRIRLRSAFGGLRGLVDVSVAAAIARCERQAAVFKLDDLSDRDLRDIGLYRDRFGLVLPERDGPLDNAPRFQAKPEAGWTRR
jgi:uncharacterized protein YjiS (DUF1127 family)